MKILQFRTTEEQEAAIDRTVEHLGRGGLLAYPTETTYGLGSALYGPALDQIATLKSGREGKPFLLLIADRSHAPGLHWTAAAEVLARAFWPGPLTLALTVDPGIYPAHVVSAGTVAVRHSPHAGLQLLLTRYGQPISSTSANRRGEPPALDPRELAGLLAVEPSADSFLLLDGGVLQPSPPSTLVDCSESVPRVVRVGAIPVDALKRYIHELRA